MIKQGIYFIILITWSLFNNELKSQSNQSALQVPDGIPLKEEQINFPGEGTFTAKAWVKCISGDQLTLKPDIPKDPSHCYVWLTGKIENYSTPIPNCNLHEYEVKPCEESGVYLVKVYDKTGNIIHKSCFVVYIVTGLELWERDGITECMDEYSTINIKGKLLGKGMERVSTDMTPITISYYQHQSLPEFKKNDCNIKNGQFTDVTIDVPEWNHDYAVGSADRYELIPIARWNNSDAYCRSYSSYWISVRRLWITKFKHQLAPNDWMVVVGEPIEHDVFALPGLSNFEWSFEDKWGDLDHNNVKSGNQLAINYSKIYPPLDNNHFGTTYGNVIVKCYDNKNQKYEVSSGVSFHSSQLQPYIRSMSQNPFQIKAKVFYPKNDIVIPPFQNPNWYEYWTSFVREGSHKRIKNKYKSIDFIYYSYAETNAGFTSSTGTDWYYEITYYDKSKDINDLTLHNGIECFYEIVAHERYHVTINRDYWPLDKYIPTDDSDQDFISDKWELMHSKDGFRIGPKENLKTSGVKTRYEENLCRNIEVTLPNRSKFNSQDWSYDKNLFFSGSQGKQWK